MGLRPVFHARRLPRLHRRIPFHKIDADDVELKQYGSIPEEAFIVLHTGTGWYSNTRAISILPSSLCRCGTHHQLRPVAVSVSGPPWTTAGKTAPSTAPSCQ
ncbi:MAG: hypothetical protein ACLU4B_04385 [Bilophila wadsworthia]